MNSDEKILVKYSEDLAQYADLRPVVHQPMTLHELVGLVLATTGKDAARMRERLRHGTCTYNIYRYWWDGFELDEAALAAALAAYPDPDPSRPFCADACQWVRFSDERAPRPHVVEFEKGELQCRRWLRRRSFWDFLLEVARARQPAYHDYSYYRRADVYRVRLEPRDLAVFREAARRLAPHALRPRLARLAEWVLLELGCARP